MSLGDVRTVAGYAIREGVRRRVLVVVLVLTAAFLALFAYGAQAAFDAVDGLDIGGGAVDFEEQVFTGSTLLGLAMFVTLFLGTVLAIFLTLSTVRGDAERGLLQPLVVRPVGRDALLAGRFAAAAAICSAYVVGVYAAAVAICELTGGFMPGRLFVPAVGLAGAVVVICALSLLGSTLLGTTANGIAVFMTFGAGLAGGLLGQIGRALQVDTLEQIADVAVYVLPFQALYQDGLHALTADIDGITGIAVRLGPFGSAQDGGALLWPYALAYVALVGVAAALAFRRADL
jgi:ABC-type transport system involved in multi-copper enzyme maturation permease subunit